jgi:hypothetical protein
MFYRLVLSLLCGEGRRRGVHTVVRPLDGGSLYPAVMTEADIVPEMFCVF